MQDKYALLADEFTARTHSFSHLLIVACQWGQSQYVLRQQRTPCFSVATVSCKLLEMFFRRPATTQYLVEPAKAVPTSTRPAGSGTERGTRWDRCTAGDMRP